MDTLSEEQGVIESMAKEFLEYRLGVEASNENVCRLAAHIIQFEKEIQQPRLQVVAEGAI